MDFLFKKSIFLAFFLVGTLTGLQAQVLRNDMVSAGGGSHQVKGSNLTVHQSIGQSSVNGTFTNSPTTLMQGFLRGIKIKTREQEKPFEVISYPNFFSKTITFRFTQEHQDQTSFTIFDINGKKVFDVNHVPLQNEVELNLDHLAAGIYITIIRSGNRIIQKRIIKKE